ncbi:transcription termination factor 2-like [Protopterus annectens]|uniref:transcription termination factor 2-like n=1 Tax=Protopterus annectens TaxID=7888 RepID=UPI001CFA1768|nr:transcription termination factor 2-like [Protopterus annectens]
MDKVVCEKHGILCMLKTGVRDGPNKGKSFYICGAQHGQCLYTKLTDVPVSHCLVHEDSMVELQGLLQQPDTEQYRLYFRCVKGKADGRKWCGKVPWQDQKSKKSPAEQNSCKVIQKSQKPENERNPFQTVNKQQNMPVWKAIGQEMALKEREKEQPTEKQVIETTSWREKPLPAGIKIKSCSEKTRKNVGENEKSCEVKNEDLLNMDSNKNFDKLKLQNPKSLKSEPLVTREEINIKRDSQDQEKNKHMKSDRNSSVKKDKAKMQHVTEGSKENSDTFCKGKVSEEPRHKKTHDIKCHAGMSEKHNTLENFKKAAQKLDENRVGKDLKFPVDKFKNSSSSNETSTGKGNVSENYTNVDGGQKVLASLVTSAQKSSFKSNEAPEKSGMVSDSNSPEGSSVSDGQTLTESKNTKDRGDGSGEEKLGSIKLEQKKLLNSVKPEQSKPIRLTIEKEKSVKTSKHNSSVDCSFLDEQNSTVGISTTQNDVSSGNREISVISTITEQHKSFRQNKVTEKSEIVCVSDSSRGSAVSSAEMTDSKTNGIVVEQKLGSKQGQSSKSVVQDESLQKCKKDNEVGLDTDPTVSSGCVSTDGMNVAKNVLGSGDQARCSIKPELDSTMKQTETSGRNFIVGSHELPRTSPFSSGVVLTEEADVMKNICGYHGGLLDTSVKPGQSKSVIKPEDSELSNVNTSYDSLKNYPAESGQASTEGALTKKECTYNTCEGDVSFVKPGQSQIIRQKEGTGKSVLLTGQRVLTSFPGFSFSLQTSDAQDPFVLHSQLSTQLKQKKATLAAVNVGALPDKGQRLINQVKELEDALGSLSLSTVTGNKQANSEKSNFQEVVSANQFNPFSIRGTTEQVGTTQIMRPPAIQDLKSNSLGLHFHTAASRLGSGQNYGHVYGVNPQQHTFYGGRMTEDRLLAVRNVTGEAIDHLHRSLESCPTAETTCDDPPGLKVCLLPHQTQALAWLLWRETEKPAGGILADDMGLGKTLTMIALILAQKHKDNKKEDTKLEKWISKHDASLVPSHGTLIICPASLVHHWKKEIERHVSGSKLRVCLYHGQNREKNPHV